MSFMPRDVIILPEMGQGFPGRWLAMNVFAKTSLGVTSEVLGLLDRETSGNPMVLPETFMCWEVEYYSNERGLLADPTRYHRKPEDWRELRLAPDAMLDKLRTHCILIDDEAAYRARFQPKRNLLDRERFGNFHQQHGQHMMLTRREDPAAWWMRQKFTEDLTQVRQDNLYGGVQWHFLEEYFYRCIRPGMRVVDLGCGTGIYSNLLASCGAKVLGVDPSDQYLEVAQRHAVEGTSFLKADIGDEGGLSTIPDESADVVFMSDALLFYFVPFFPGQKADIQVLLADIKRILKPGGLFLSLEPHAVFYLAPWLGSVDRPFTVVTEYRDKQFGIVPPYAWLFNCFAEGGFAVRNFHELGPSDGFREADARAYHFAREFPIWQLLELIKVE